MKKLTITLTDEQYRFAKQWGRLWLKSIVQELMDSGYDGGPIKRPWWKQSGWFWR